jgi:hypothetical protein
VSLPIERSLRIVTKHNDFSGAPEMPAIIVGDALKSFPFKCQRAETPTMGVSDE